VTLVHELGHLFLGHLGPDKALSVPKRQALTHAQRELEAESVAYIVGVRNDVHSKSETYLANFVQHAETIDDLDVYQIMRAAGQVEMLLGLISHTQFEPPRSRRVPQTKPAP
jgi:antirestriction protein ArdC